MKTLLIGLLALGSISAHAAGAYKMDQAGVTVLNDVVGAIKGTKEAATFAKNVSFDEVTADFSADKKDAIIEAKGMFIVGGDMACGDLKIRIERSSKFNGWGFTTTYKSTLDKSQISDQPFCVLEE
jgi:hypothetical protein